MSTALPKESVSPVTDNPQEDAFYEKAEASVGTTLAIQGKAHLLDWAETLLCNSLPMSHCTQEEWDRIIKSWRDQKHGL